MKIEHVQAFLAELEKNNNKAWFDAHKDDYQAEIVAPILSLVSALEQPLSALDPPLQAVSKTNGSLRRIYRDTRFSKDKTPYNTHVHLVFWAGNHATKSPGTHIALHQDGYGFGAGFWALDNVQLERMRKQIVSDKGKKISQAVAAVEAHDVALMPPQLARVPRGFDADAPYANWLKYKGLVVRKERQPYDPSIFNDAEKLEGFIVELCDKMSPLNRYLMEQVF